VVDVQVVDVADEAAVRDATAAALAACCTRERSKLRPKPYSW